MAEVINVAVSGQPNCGKSTMFNAITGATARVGNYPGITVDRLEGSYRLNGYNIRLVDLPGTYSLTSYSMEEVVARNVIVDERPDVVLCMLDSTALERSLYLVLQLMEIGVPIVLGLNMMDEAKRIGLRIDSKKLSELLGVPAVECVARLGQGKQELMRAVADTAEKTKGEWKPLDINYGNDLEPIIEEMVAHIKGSRFMEDRYAPRWLAVKYLEGDEIVMDACRKVSASAADELESFVAKADSLVAKTRDSYPEAIIADMRYGFINGLVRQGVLKREDDLRYGFSDKIDKVLTHRLFGPLIMLAVLWVMFDITFTLGAYPQGWVEDLFGLMAAGATAVLPEGLMRSLIVSGILDGVGAVVSFTPLILIMFTMLVFLEDLGYMARVAYMVDRVFRIFGLHGMSVMPLIMAGGMPGGCAVPGVMCARTLRSPLERLATILTAPFMVCGAKTTAYIMLTAAFFPGKATLVMFLIVVTSWVFVLLVSRVLRWTVVKGPTTPFVMELPPYRLPTVRGVAIHAWDRVWQYLKKAGTVILAIAVIMWALMTFPRLPEDRTAAFENQRQEAEASVKAEHGLTAEMAREKLDHSLAEINDQEGEEALKYSVAGRIAMGIQPVTDLAGFPWQADIALIGAFAAKEVFVSTMATAYSMGDVDPDMSEGLSKRLAADPAWTMPAIISVLLFMLLYTPCMVTVVAIAKESNWKWAAFSVGGSLVFAYFVSVAVYQVGRVLA